MIKNSPSRIGEQHRQPKKPTDVRGGFQHRTLNVLMIEDLAADAELIQRELNKSGMSFRFSRVETRAEFEAELKNHPPDLILSDHGLPAFDGFAALAAAQTSCPDVPFIFVTGASGEEITIEAFENGGADYVLKDQLSKLLPTVHRALHKAEARQVYRMVEADRERLIQELYEALERIKHLSGLLSICCSCKKIRDDRGVWKPFEVYFCEHANLMFSHGYCPECFERTRTEFETRHLCRPGSAKKT